MPDDQLTATIDDLFGDRADKAHAYHRLLETDGHVRGFIGPREIPKLWERHILNCAIAGQVFAEGARLVDIGSGAGLPGIPLALARPDLTLVLVETQLKRCVFLGEVVEALGLNNVTVVRGRCEDKAIIAAAGGADVATSRAVAPLGKLVGWSLPLVRVGGEMIALKGQSAAEELERDRAEIKRASGRNPRVESIGDDQLGGPVTLVRVTRGK